MNTIAKRKRLAAAGGSKPFSILLGSITLLSIGNKIYELVLPLMIYELTQSAVAMTAMRTAELLPNFLFAILIGVMVDRVNQKRWALWMIGLQTLLLLVLIFLYKEAVAPLTVYYVIGFLLMSFNYGFFNVQVSLTKRTVTPEGLTGANAKIGFVEMFVTVMGPALSGLVFLVSELSDGIMITTILYAAGLLMLSKLTLDSTEGEQGRPKGSWVSDLKEGWKTFTTNRLLLGITLFVAFLNCSMTVATTTVVFYAKDVLHMSSPMLALTLSASGLGGILGSLLVGKARARWGFGRLFGFCMLVNGACYFMLSLADSAVVLTAALFINGLAASMNTIALYAFRQEQTPPRLMGRIAGITGTVFRAGMPVAMLLSGQIITYYGSAAIFVLAAAWNIAAFLVYLRTKLWQAR